MTLIYTFAVFSISAQLTSSSSFSLSLRLRSIALTSLSYSYIRLLDCCTLCDRLIPVLGICFYEAVWDKCFVTSSVPPRCALTSAFVVDAGNFIETGSGFTPVIILDGPFNLFLCADINWVRGRLPLARLKVYASKLWRPSSVIWFFCRRFPWA